MDSLHRLITYSHDQEAYREWRQRYGHDYPVFAELDGKEQKYEP